MCSFRSVRGGLAGSAEVTRNLHTAARDGDSHPKRLASLCDIYKVGKELREAQ